MKQIPYETVEEFLEAEKPKHDSLGVRVYSLAQVARASPLNRKTLSRYVHENFNGYGDLFFVHPDTDNIYITESNLGIYFERHITPCFTHPGMKSMH